MKLIRLIKRGLILAALIAVFGIVYIGLQGEAIAAQTPQSEQSSQTSQTSQAAQSDQSTQAEQFTPVQPSQGKQSQQSGQASRGKQSQGKQSQGKQSQQAGQSPRSNQPAQTAQVILRDPAGVSALSGQIALTETSQGLQVNAQVDNAPLGWHGFHIHENGSCDNAGNGAGGHFNPNNVKHGKLIVDGFDQAHAGDLGNILVAADGHGTLSQTVPGLTLSDGIYAIANRAVILHAQRDDFSQPVGNAGARIGCGTIDLTY